MPRHQDWTERLNEFLETNRNREFERGFFDCAVFAGLAVQAMTGDDYVEDYIGQYSNKKEAYKYLKTLGVGDLEGMAEKHLGEPLLSPHFAKRGDVVLLELDGETALAVVDLTGRHAVTTGLKGLVYLKPNHWVKAWRVV